MDKRKQTLRDSLETPLLGFLVVVLALSCLLVLLWGIIIVTRMVLM